MGFWMLLSILLGPPKKKKTSCKEAMCFFKLKLEPHGNASHEQLTRSWFQPIPGIMPVRYEVKPVTWAFECPTFPATAADIGPGNKKLLGTTAELQTPDATMATCTLYSSAGLALCEGLGFAGVLQPDHPPQLTDWQKIATLHPCFWTQELPSSLQHVFSLNHHPPFFICSFPIFSRSPQGELPRSGPDEPRSVAPNSCSTLLSSAEAEARCSASWRGSRGGDKAT